MLLELGKWRGVVLRFGATLGLGSCHTSTLFSYRKHRWKKVLIKHKQVNAVAEISLRAGRFVYLVLSVDTPSNDLGAQHAAPDIQSVFCSSGCPLGSCECPTHGTYFRTNGGTKTHKEVITRRLTRSMLDTLCDIRLIVGNFGVFRRQVATKTRQKMAALVQTLAKLWLFVSSRLWHGDGWESFEDW